MVHTQVVFMGKNGGPSEMTRWDKTGDSPVYGSVGQNVGC